MTEAYQPARESQELKDAIHDDLADKVKRSEFPTMPVETLVLANFGITRRQLERVKEVHDVISNPDVKAGLGKLMTQMIRDRDDRMLDLLGEVQCEADDELINQQFPKKEEEKPPKTPFGFSPPEPIHPSPTSGELLPVAQE